MPRSPDREAFDAFVRRADNAMLVVTAAADDRLAGCLVGFHAQASIEPPRYLVLLSKANHTYQVARDAESLGIHLLDADAEALARLFGGETDDDPGVDKFARCRWERATEQGPPLLVDLPSRFVGRILERYDCGDHVAMLVEPGAARSADDDAPPLRYAAVADLPPGHEA